MELYSSPEMLQAKIGLFLWGICEERRFAVEIFGKPYPKQLYLSHRVAKVHNS
jgi:hypothetical protein